MADRPESIDTYIFESTCKTLLVHIRMADSHVEQFQVWEKRKGMRFALVPVLQVHDWDSAREALENLLPTDLQWDSDAMIFLSQVR